MLAHRRVDADRSELLFPVALELFSVGRPHVRSHIESCPQCGRVLIDGISLLRRYRSVQKLVLVDEPAVQARGNPELETRSLALYFTGLSAVDTTC